MHHINTSDSPFNASLAIDFDDGYTNLSQIESVCPTGTPGTFVYNASLASTGTIDYEQLEFGFGKATMITALSTHTDLRFQTTQSVCDNDAAYSHFNDDSIGHTMFKEGIGNVVSSPSENNVPMTPTIIAIATTSPRNPADWQVSDRPRDQESLQKIAKLHPAPANSCSQSSTKKAKNRKAGIPKRTMTADDESSSGACPDGETIVCNPSLAINNLERRRNTGRPPRHKALPRISRKQPASNNTSMGRVSSHTLSSPSDEGPVGGQDATAYPGHQRQAPVIEEPRVPPTALASLEPGKVLDGRVLAEIILAAADSGPGMCVAVLNSQLADRDVTDSEDIDVCETTTHAILPILHQRCWTAAFICLRERRVEFIDSRPCDDRNVAWQRKQVHRVAIAICSRIGRFDTEILQFNGGKDETAQNNPTSLEEGWTYASSPDQISRPDEADSGIHVLVQCVCRIQGITLTTAVDPAMWRELLRSWFQVDNTHIVRGSITIDLGLQSRSTNTKAEWADFHRQLQALQDVDVILKWFGAAPSSSMLRQRLEQNRADLKLSEEITAKCAELRTPHKQLTMKQVVSLNDTLTMSTAALEKCKEQRERARSGWRFASLFLKQIIEGRQVEYEALCARLQSEMATHKSWFNRFHNDDGSPSVVH